MIPGHGGLSLALSVATFPLPLLGTQVTSLEREYEHEKSGGSWEGQALASVTWHRNFLWAIWAGSLRQAERSVEARTCFYGAHLFLDGCLPELERIR